MGLKNYENLVDNFTLTPNNLHEQWTLTLENFFSPALPFLSDSTSYELSVNLVKKSNNFHHSFMFYTIKLNKLGINYYS